MKLLRVALLGLVASLVLAGSAQAGTITCPAAPSTGDRVFALTTVIDATCFAQGSGNMADNQPGAGWTFLDKDQASDFNAGIYESWLTVDPTFAGGLTTSGTFYVSNAAWANFDQILVGIKTGCGSRCELVPNPDWVIFQLAPNTTSGTFSIYEFPDLDTQGVSHLSLWGGSPIEGCSNGDCVPTLQTSVPEPTSLLLFGTGAMFLAAKLKRKKA